MNKLVAKTAAAGKRAKIRDHHRNRPREVCAGDARGTMPIVEKKKRSGFYVTRNRKTATAPQKPRRRRMTLKLRLGVSAMELQGKAETDSESQAMAAEETRKKNKCGRKAVPNNGCRKRRHFCLPTSERQTKVS